MMMEEVRAHGGRRQGGWLNRLTISGTALVAMTLGVLMTLAPAGASAIGTGAIFAHPFKGTTSTVYGYTSFSGCGRAKPVVAAWHSLSGTTFATGRSTASTCGKPISFFGGYSDGYGETGIEVGIPFHAAVNGNNSIATSWTLSLATAASFSSGGCPAKNINYHPPLNQYASAFCETGIAYYWNEFASLVDLNNNSWFSYNTSYVSAYNNSGWENYTDCFNYGIPTCSNNTGSYGYGSVTWSNNAPFSSFTWNGVTTFTLWNNGTGMLRSHHYLLVFSLTIDTDAYAYKSGLIGPWTGTASTLVNMGTLGNGATLNSITVT